MSDIATLRTALFDELKRVQDKNEKFDAARTRAVTEISGRILDSARVEIDYARATRRSVNTGFLPQGSDPILPEPPKPQEQGDSLTQTGVKSVSGAITTHRMR